MVKPDPVLRIGDKKYLLMTLRQSLIMALGGIEDYMGMERSIIPKHRRDKEGLDKAHQGGMMSARGESD